MDWATELFTSRVALSFRFPTCRLTARSAAQLQLLTSGTNPVLQRQRAVLYKKIREADDFCLFKFLQGLGDM